MDTKEATEVAPNKPTAPNPAIAFRLHVGHHWRGIGESERSSECRERAGREAVGPWTLLAPGRQDD